MRLNGEFMESPDESRKFKINFYNSKEEPIKLISLVFVLHSTSVKQVIINKFKYT